MATILVTGGAGYLGSHCCLALTRAGHEVVVYDNLSNGHACFARFTPLEQGDIRDAGRLREVFETYRPDAVLHCAALIEVGESVKFPERFHDVNVHGTQVLLDAMRATGTRAFVFSSSCAVYGAPERLPMDETHRYAPASPYGQNKLDAERQSDVREREHLGWPAESERPRGDFHLIRTDRALNHLERILIRVRDERAPVTSLRPVGEPRQDLACGKCGTVFAISIIGDQSNTVTGSKTGNKISRRPLDEL